MGLKMFMETRLQVIQRKHNSWETSDWGGAGGTALQNHLAKRLYFTI